MPWRIGYALRAPTYLRTDFTDRYSNVQTPPPPPARGAAGSGVARGGRSALSTSMSYSATEARRLRLAIFCRCMLGITHFRCSCSSGVLNTLKPAGLVRLGELYCEEVRGRGLAQLAVVGRGGGVEVALARWEGCCREPGGWRESGGWRVSGGWRESGWWEACVGSWLRGVWLWAAWWWLAGCGGDWWWSAPMERSARSWLWARQALYLHYIKLELYMTLQ